MKTMFTALLVTICLSATAADLNTNGLTDEQKLKLQIQINEMKNPARTTAESVSEWVGLGEQIGKALGASARELNVTVNEFASTPVGLLTCGLIVWKVVGRELVQVVVGAVFALFGTLIWIYLYRRMCLIRSVKVEDKIKTYEYYSADDMKNDNLFWLRFWMIVLFLVIVGISQTIMWA